ncbi:hypothetical protein [Blastopirellula marina]|uniref:GAP1-N2 domain-containing protein n=1 Tax=Blastopirellula marina TaxID=124 RepID=UPI0011B02557|nr:hypothetical protein [Blastopirellula marina]
MADVAILSSNSSSLPPSSSVGTVPVEQAIFTSAQTTSKDGYQLVAWSHGINAEDARQLAIWGPAHDSMIAEDPADVSLNFHPLGKDKYCISRTMLGTAEYSGRGGRQVYTHCFVVRAAGFARFHNDPFRIVSAALAIRDLRPGAELPTDLPTLTMLPSGPPVEPGLIRFFDSPSQQQTLVAWFHHALSSRKLLFTGSYTDRYLSVFFNLLPVSVRPCFPFSTRLRYSPRRDFRLIGLGNDLEEQKKAARQEGFSVFPFDSVARTPDLSRHPWATWVQVALCQKDPDEAARLIGELPLSTQPGNLASLGNRLRMAFSGKRRKEEPSQVAPTPFVDQPKREEPEQSALDPLLQLVERSLDGDISALEQLTSAWETPRSAAREAQREQCAEHFLKLARERAPSERSSMAVEILSLILHATP